MTDMSQYDITAPEESAINDYHGAQPFLKNSNDFIMQWTPWYNFGHRSKIDNSNIKINNENYNKMEYDLREQVNEAMNIVFQDYISDYKNSEWPNFITSWELSTKLGFSEIEILKHHIKPKEKYAILFHTDRHEHRIHMAGGKQIITFTFYLNDNYEGGEVEFIDEAKNQLFTYKPGAGDITVFPSGLPFWHSAKAVTSGENKIFLRVFINWEHSGSKEYLEGVKKYGKIEYDKIVMNEARDVVSQNVVGRQVIRVGEDPSALKTKAILIHDENRFYIDGRTKI
jgi:hypothetical protein